MSPTRAIHLTTMASEPLPGSPDKAKPINEKEGASEDEVKAVLTGLSEQEQEIIRKQLTTPDLTIGYFTLFRYASRKDVAIMIVALVASIAAGAVMPLMTVSNTYISNQLDIGKSFSSAAMRHLSASS